MSIRRIVETGFEEEFGYLYQCFVITIIYNFQLKAYLNARALLQAKNFNLNTL